MIQELGAERDNESCSFSYLSQTGQKEKLFHIASGVEAKLPFLYMIKKNNSICSLDHAQDGSKITFLKSGSYQIMYKIRIKGSSDQMIPTKIVIKTTPNNHSHYLYYEHMVHLNNEFQFISGYAICPFEQNEFMYFNISANADIDISCDSTIYTSIDIIRIGSSFSCTSFDDIYNGFTHQ